METITNYIYKRFDRTVKEQEPDISEHPDGPNILENPGGAGVLARKTEGGGAHPETTKHLPSQGVGSSPHLLVGSVTSGHVMYICMCACMYVFIYSLFVW